MPYTTYQTINDLDTKEFIGGSEQTLIYDVVDDSGSTISIIGGYCHVLLCYYQQPDTPVLDALGVISGSPGRFIATLSAEDTLELDGIFVQQPIVQTADGTIFRPSQGIIHIIPAIQGM
jgi:hypothetical protein